MSPPFSIKCSNLRNISDNYKTSSQTGLRAKLTGYSIGTMKTFFFSQFCCRYWDFILLIPHQTLFRLRPKEGVISHKPGLIVTQNKIKSFNSQMGQN